MLQNSAVATAVVEPQTEKVWPTYDHEIGMTEAREMIARWRRANPGTKHGAAFTHVAFERLLSQEGCVGIRLYYAQHADGMPTLVMVGTDMQGNDMDEGELAEFVYPCPPFCAINSALDS